MKGAVQKKIKKILKNPPNILFFQRKPASSTPVLFTPGLPGGRRSRPQRPLRRGAQPGAARERGRRQPRPWAAGFACPGWEGEGGGRGRATAHPRRGAEDGLGAGSEELSGEEMGGWGWGLPRRRPPLGPAARRRRAGRSRPGRAERAAGRAANGGGGRMRGPGTAGPRPSASAGPGAGARRPPPPPAAAEESGGRRAGSGLRLRSRLGRRASPPAPPRRQKLNGNPAGRPRTRRAPPRAATPPDPPSSARGWDGDGAPGRRRRRRSRGGGNGDRGGGGRGRTHRMNFLVPRIQDG